MAGFKKFLLRGNLVDLAVAVLIATAFGTLVVALTKDFITPLIAAIGGKPDFSSSTSRSTSPSSCTATSSTR